MKNSNGKVWRILAVVVIVLFAAYGVVYSYGQLNSRVEALETGAKRAEDTRERVIKIEEGVKYLIKAVDRIEKKIE